MVHFVRALQQHRSSHKRVKLFSRLVGSDHVQAPAPLNLRDANFLMEVGCPSRWQQQHSASEKLHVPDLGKLCFPVRMH